MRAMTFSKIITTRAEHDEAIRRVIELLEQGPHAKDSGPAQEIALLHLLTQDYCDRTHPPLPKAKSHEILEFLMEQNDMSQGDLVPFIGDKSTVSLVLAGKRRLTPAACRKLKERFRVDFPAIVGKEIMETTPVRIRARRTTGKRKTVR